MKTTLSRPSLIPLAAAVLLVSVLSADAVPRFLLKIADHHGDFLIPGDAPEPHTEWIEVHGFGNKIDCAEGEEGSALPPVCNQRDFHVHKCLDRASVPLQEALVRGSLLPEVQIKYLGSSSSGTDGSEPLVVVLRHVQVTGYEVRFDLCPRTGEPLPMEQFSFNFSESEWVYRRHDDDGEVEEETGTVLTAFLSTEDPGFDDDGDGIPNDLDPDDDNDGIPDESESSTGTNPHLDDAHLDLDNDGATNGEEHLANTRANDPNSKFAIRSVVMRHTPEGTEGTVILTTAPGCHYRLLASTDPRMPKEAWMVLAEFDTDPGAPEEQAEISLPAGMVGRPGQLYFRADVSMRTP